MHDLHAALYKVWRFGAAMLPKNGTLSGLFEARCSGESPGNNQAITAGKSTGFAALLPGLILQVCAVSGWWLIFCRHSPGLTGLRQPPGGPIQEAEIKRVTVHLG